MKQIHVDLITESVRLLCIDAACDLPQDVETKLREAVVEEESKFGRYSLEKIVKNFELARRDQVPMCQDTGIVLVFATVGQNLHIVGGTLTNAINEGVRQGYTEGYLRKSVVKDPVFNRQNTGDNTPAVIYTELVEGDELKLIIMPKGAGSENMSGLKMLKPAEGIEGVKQFILDAVTNAGGNPCPPVIVGVGIGGTMDQATLLSKKALIRHIGQPHPDSNYAQLEEELLREINKLGIGPQGFGGKVTALAVHIETFPTHIATLPVAITLNCHAARHKEITL